MHDPLKEDRWFKVGVSLFVLAVLTPVLMMAFLPLGVVLTPATAALFLPLAFNAGG